MGSSIKFKDFLKDQNKWFNVLAVLGALYLVFNILCFLKLIYKYTFGKCACHKKKLRPDKNEWAVVTGGSDGIGLAIAKNLAARGFNIVVVGRNITKVHQKLKEIQQVNQNIQTRSIIADLA